MTFTEAVKTCYTKKYADFNGRASRSEFWWFFAFYSLVNVGIYLLVLLSAAIATANDPHADSPVSVVALGLLLAFDLASIAPYIAAVVRRLHDTGRSGTHYLLVLVPWVGHLIVLVLCAQRPLRGPNMYGPDPLDPNGHPLALANPYAQPYGYPAQPFSHGYPAQPGAPQGDGHLLYGAATFTDQPAAPAYSRPSAPQQSPAAPHAAPTGQDAVSASRPSAPQPAQDTGQQPYDFDFSRPEGYGSGN